MNVQMMNASWMKASRVKAACMALVAGFAVAACQTGPHARKSVTYAGQASTATPATTATPVWRNDVTYLSADQGALQTCFNAVAQDDGDEAECTGVVISRCLADLPPEGAATTGAVRVCVWRGIAAWEEILEAAVDTYLADVRDDERSAFNDAQTAWQAFLTANVRSRAAQYAGGSLEAVVAGETRVRTTAARAIEIREELRDRAMR